MNLKSLDPRVNRLPGEGRWVENYNSPVSDQHITFEVFIQMKDTRPYEHAGVVHAANAEMAMLYGKEQFSRRFTCSGMWVVPTSLVKVSPFTDAGKSVYEMIEKATEPSGGAEHFDIFHLDKRGKQHKHVGTVIAGSAEEALHDAANQFQSDKPVLNIWVIRSNDLYRVDKEDIDIWDTLPEKKHRDVISYRGAERLKEYGDRLKR